MGKVSYNELNNTPTSNQSNGNYPVKFFSLKNGEDAIVRILLDSISDFDIRTVHSVKLDGWQYGRNVNCIMENGDARTCPLCSSGEKLIQKLYIKLLKYSTGEDGKVVVTPMVWERNRFDKVFGAQPLANYISTYGPLSDIICRISRSGEGLNTVYTPTFGLNIMPNSKAIYRDDIYVKDTSLFGDFDVLGVSIMDKNYSELSHFVQTGNFPQRDANEGAPQRATADASINVPQVGQYDTKVATHNDTFPPVTVSPATVPAVGYGNINPNDENPWGSNASFNRPRRY